MRQRKLLKQEREGRKRDARETIVILLRVYLQSGNSSRSAPLSILKMANKRCTILAGSSLADSL